MIWPKAKQQALAAFERLWLPAFLLFSVTWLLAPAVHHVEAGSLSVISTFEAIHQPMALFFRFCDAVGGVLLALGTAYAGVYRRDRTLAVLLYVYAVLSVIDVIFAAGCVGSCSAADHISHGIHNLESVISPVVLAAITVTDIVRTRRLTSQLFMLLQLFMAAILLSRIAGHQLLVTMQYIYEVVLAAWLAWLVAGYMRPYVLGDVTRLWVRRAFGAWALLNGILALLLAFHVRVYGPVFGLTFAARQPWLAHPSILAGVALLYVARHIAQGQRRAAWLLAAVFAAQLAHYALFEPAPVLLVLNLVSLVVLWVGWQSFDRNTGPLPFTARLKDVLVIVGGVVAAFAVLLSLATLAGRERTLQNDLQHVYATQVQERLRTGRPDRDERRRSHLRLTTNELFIVTGAFVLWSLFRPSGKVQQATAADRIAAESLLERLSDSSEDFFKLWPHDKQYFFTADRQSFVAYKVSRKVAFALADPVAPPNRRAVVLEQFLAHCRQNGWQACFFVIDERNREMYESAGLRTVQIGSSAVIDVRTFTGETVRDKWWRWQANRAKREQLEYESLRPPYSPEVMRALREVSDAWLTRAGHTEQGFALGYFDAAYLQRCRLHVLRDRGGQIVAFTNQLPTYNANRQATVDLIRFLPDVQGAMPVLTMQLIGRLAAEAEFATFDLGFVPLAKLEGAVPAIARLIGAGRFSAAGLEQFKSKFKPEWRPQYLAYDGDIVDLAGVLANLERVLKP